VRRGKKVVNELRGGKGKYPAMYGGGGGGGKPIASWLTIETFLATFGEDQRYNTRNNRRVKKRVKRARGAHKSKKSEPLSATERDDPVGRQKGK